MTQELKRCPGLVEEDEGAVKLRSEGIGERQRLPKAFDAGEDVLFRKAADCRKSAISGGASRGLHLHDG